MKTKMKQPAAVDMQQLVNIAKSMNMRVGQLIVNAFSTQGGAPLTELFHAADDKIIVVCRQYAARACRATLIRELQAHAAGLD